MTRIKKTEEKYFISRFTNLNRVVTFGELLVWLLFLIICIILSR